MRKDWRLSTVRCMSRRYRKMACTRRSCGEKDAAIATLKAKLEAVNRTQDILHG